MSSPNEQALSMAVDWLVRHEAAALSRMELEAFEEWLSKDASHQVAWDRVNTALSAPINTIRRLQPHDQGSHVRAAMQTLFKTRRRRVLRGALSVGGVGLLSVLVADRLAPLGQVMADLRTGTGERRKFFLDDGSTVLLDARSGVDVSYVAGVPVLQHRAGAMIITRAFSSSTSIKIHTRDGLAQMESGSMMSRIHADRSEVIAIDSNIVLQSRSLTQLLLRNGEGVRFSSSLTERLHGDVLSRTSWQQGMLAVDDWSLAEVAQALEAYFPGFIRVSPSAAKLRVFGIFELEVQQLLDTLAEILPLQIRRLGPFVSIDSRDVL